MYQQVSLIGKVYSFALPRDKNSHNHNRCIAPKDTDKFERQLEKLKGFREFTLQVTGEYIIIFDHIWDDLTLANKLKSIADKIGWDEGEWVE